MTYYPPVAFHFSVSFQLPGLNQYDIQFQEVNGLNVSLETEDYIEGGENRFPYKLPTRTQYADLELKRGFLPDSGITRWVQDAIEKFEFQAADLIVSLLNEAHEPLVVWQIVGAIPITWTIDSLNAQESKILVENLTLSYHYFKMKKQ